MRPRIGIHGVVAVEFREMTRPGELGFATMIVSDSFVIAGGGPTATA
jgi:hypothetical protein